MFLYLYSMQDYELIIAEEKELFFRYIELMSIMRYERGSFLNEPEKRYLYTLLLVSRAIPEDSMRQNGRLFSKSMLEQGAYLVRDLYRFNLALKKKNFLSIVEGKMVFPYFVKEYDGKRIQATVKIKIESEG